MKFLPTSRVAFKLLITLHSKLEVGFSPRHESPFGVINTQLPNVNKQSFGARYLPTNKTVSERDVLAAVSSSPSDTTNDIQPFFQFVSSFNAYLKDENRCPEITGLGDMECYSMATNKS
ncbi:Uncharacterized protein HZ326_22261 [Fusarium oxysporum f. sp. albedinis]|nr:Uncharacterized protein HZ326_22261 [Fusarium oxysporum f. sp. albedinis]